MNDETASRVAEWMRLLHPRGIPVDEFKNILSEVLLLSKLSAHAQAEQILSKAETGSVQAIGELNGKAAVLSSSMSQLERLQIVLKEPKTAPQVAKALNISPKSVHPLFAKARDNKIDIKKTHVSDDKLYRYYI